MPTLSLTVNGQAESLQIPADRLLVDVLRQDLGLTGTHVGCDTAQCGACTVLLNGHAVKACNVLALQAAGCEISTIEGHGLQCGFCTPGMVMSAVDLVQNHACESEADIRNGLDGNFCRCTGYQNIVRAVQQGAAQMKD